MNRTQYRTQRLMTRSWGLNPRAFTSRLWLLAVASLPGVSAPAQLLHRYDFETAGSANDTVGTANGTLYGTATISGGALNTAGGAGGLSNGVPQNCAGLPASAVASITNAFSIEIWFVANYNGGYCTLFSFSDSTTANYVLATPARGTSPFQSDVSVKGGGGNAAEQLANQIYCDNATIHDMIVTYDGTNVTYYLDGTLSSYSSLQNSFADSGLNLSSVTFIGIGGGSPFADNTINGKVYDFRIYGQALNLNQAAAIYALGTNASNASISNALVSAPQFGVAFNGNLVRMPFYGSVGLHDPGTMRKEGNSYFIYGDGTGIPGNTSTDLRNWSATSVVFPNGPPSWTTNSVPGGSPNYFWAPDTAYFNGRWHMYYAYSQFGTRDSVIGVATSPSLTNAVWTDQGKVVKSYYPATSDTDTTAYNCIDPSIYVAANGSVWMSYGSYSSGILVAQIDPTTAFRLNTNSVGAQVASNGPGGGEGNTEEGSCIYQHGGYWYLFVNWGGCCNLTYSTYNIRVGRGTGPTGPYYDKNGVNLNSGGGTVLLESTARYIGPGHAAIMEENDTNWFTYHFYDGLANGYPTVGMNQLYWSADGWPVLTNDWSALYMLATDANESSGTYNGTLQNSAGFTNDPARGKVLNLNSVSTSSNYVSLPLSVGNASTFATWVNWRGGAAWQRIFDFGNDTTNYFFLTPESGSGNLRFAITTAGPGGEQQINAPFPLPTNSWHHVAVTLDGAKGIMYLDGSPVATNNSLTIRPWQTTPHNNNLGKSQFAADPFFAGELSSFRIFGRALSAADITRIYSANPALAHRYSFSTNAVTAGWDSIGMAHGILVGNAAVTNNALKVTGVSGGYANLPNSLVSGCSAVTLEFWGTFGANGNWARVFDAGGISGGNGYNELFFTSHNGSSQQQMTISTGSGTATLATGSALDNKTMHLAAIWDPASNNIAIYTNGVLEAQQAASVPSPTGVASVFDANAWCFIGRSLWSADAYLNGTIDELRLYDGRLSSQQIAADYAAGPNQMGFFDVWNGLGTNQNWSTANNWDGGKSPNPSGDSIFFAGTTGLAPDLDVNCSITALTFATNSGSFTLGTTNGSALTFASGATLANNSVAVQILNLPVIMTGAQTISAGAGNLVLTNTVSSSGTLSKVGNGALTLAAAISLSGSLSLDAGTIRLAGGTLTVPQIITSTNSATRILYFNGGTLKPSGNSDAFLASGVANAAYVRNGGVTIDTSGFNITIGQILQHSNIGGDNATDGGLTKNGSGTLAMTGANRYTGSTTVNAGTLEIAQPTLATNSTVSITNGARLQLDFSTTNVVGALVLSGTAQSPGVYSSNTVPNFISGSGGLWLLAPIATNPTNIGFTANGSLLTLSWPADHTGWRLQAQTNTPGAGIGTNWFDVVDSTATNNLSFPLDSAQRSVFFRLVYP